MLSKWRILLWYGDNNLCNYAMGVYVEFLTIISSNHQVRINEWAECAETVIPLIFSTRTL